MPNGNIKILTKLSAILSEVDYIKKDKTNEFHRYRYASEEAIKKELHPLFAKYKVLMFLSLSPSRRTVIPKDKGGNTILTDIDLVYTFMDAETGEYVERTFCGTGEDSGDKGLWKAITGAIKYILTTTFLIPTGDDPEDYATEKQSKRPVTQREGVAAVVAATPVVPVAAPVAQKIKRIYTLAKAAGCKDKPSTYKWITNETGITIRAETDFTDGAVDFILDFLENGNKPLPTNMLRQEAAERKNDDNPLESM